MAMVHAEASGVIAAPPEVVYALLRDYRTAHPRVLPKPYFTELLVEEGGVGAGTVFRTTVVVMGTMMHYHMDVSEPHPGVLAEVDRAIGLRTTFTVQPAGAGSHLTIATDWQSAEGVRGWSERMMTPRIMQKIYTEQLALIQQEVGTAEMLAA